MPLPMSAPLEAWMAAQRPELDRRLLAVFDDAAPARLAEACRYPIETGGKRFRPLLVLAAAEACSAAPSAPPEAAWAAGVALELVHTYSLVHDDLPCMDDDDERRGRPTVHKLYGEGPAVLVGDALLTAALGHIASAGLPPSQAVALIARLAKAAGPVGMIAGQAYDVGMGGPITTVEALVRLHRAKTGALIAAACAMGAIAAAADPAQTAALAGYGEAVGLAFQIADDVLDADQDADDDGPPSYVRLLGIDEARARAQACLQEALAFADRLPSPGRLRALARYTVEREL